MARSEQPQLNVTFGKHSEDYALLCKIAEPHWQMTPGKVIRQMLNERLELYRSGWRENDPATLELLNTVTALDQEARKDLEAYLVKLATKSLTAMEVPVDRKVKRPAKKNRAKLA